MTAVANDIVTISAVPAISKETRDRLTAERKRLAADPHQQSIPADLTVSATYLFRAKPGTHRVIVHDLPVPPEEAVFGDEKKYQFALRHWKRLVAQPAYPSLSRDKAAEALSKSLEDLRDRLGDTRIVFTRVRGHVECFYATNDDKVAAYLRGLIERKVGEFAQVYEQSGRQLIVVAGESFPNTEIGKRLAFARAQETGAAIEIKEA